MKRTPTVDVVVPRSGAGWIKPRVVADETALLRIGPTARPTGPQVSPQGARHSGDSSDTRDRADKYRRWSSQNPPTSCVTLRSSAICSVCSRLSACTTHLPCGEPLNDCKPTLCVHVEWSWPERQLVESGDKVTAVSSETTEQIGSTTSCTNDSSPRSSEGAVVPPSSVLALLPHGPENQPHAEYQPSTLDTALVPIGPRPQLEHEDTDLFEETAVPKQQLNRTHRTPRTPTLSKMK